MSAPGGILAIWNDREDAIAPVYEEWYRCEHIPERLAVPGFLQARRYEASDGGSPRFFTFYDLVSVDVLHSEHYLARLAAPSELTRRVMAHFQNMVRTAFVPLAPQRTSALGGWAAVAWVPQPAGVDDGRLECAMLELRKHPMVVAAHAWRAAPDAGAVSTESRLRPGGDGKAQAALVLEGLRKPDAMELTAIAESALRSAVVDGDAASVRTKVYELLGRWDASPSR